MLVGRLTLQDINADDEENLFEHFIFEYACYTPL